MLFLTGASWCALAQGAANNICRRPLWLRCTRQVIVLLWLSSDQTQWQSPLYPMRPISPQWSLNCIRFAFGVIVHCNPSRCPPMLTHHIQTWKTIETLLPKHTISFYKCSVSLGFTHTRQLAPFRISIYIHCSPLILRPFFSFRSLSVHLELIGIYWYVTSNGKLKMKIPDCG